MERETVFHTFAPFYTPESRLLILGSIPSPKSREQGFYYGHPQNRFWRVLAAVFDRPFPAALSDRKQLLREEGIALWDVLHSCEIAGADDASIRSPVPNDIAGLLSETGIQKIFTTGNKATTLYRKYCLSSTGIDTIPLPSTSPANARASLEVLTAAYSAALSTSF